MSAHIMTKAKRLVIRYTTVVLNGIPTKCTAEVNQDSGKGLFEDGALAEDVLVEL